jgi:hypothetical protein
MRWAAFRRESLIPAVRDKSAMRVSKRYSSGNVHCPVNRPISAQSGSGLVRPEFMPLVAFRTAPALRSGRFLC